MGRGHNRCLFEGKVTAVSIQWGAWKIAGDNNGMRVGVEVRYSAVNHSSTTCTVYFDVYTQNYYDYSGDVQTLTFGGTAGSGTFGYTNTSGSSTSGPDVAILRTTQSWTYTYGATEYGSSPGTRTFSATVSGAYNGVTPTMSVTATIPARPYAAPAAPTGVTATRVSDTQQTIAWTVTATAGAPYSAQVVQRATDAGGWVAIATVSGSATSYADTTTAGNHKYAYRVYAYNAIAWSPYSTATPTIFTSPAAPSGCAAAKTTAGDITVTWTDNAPYNDGVEVWRLVDGVLESSAAATLGDVTTWTDSAPNPAHTYAYQVRSTISTGTLASAFSPASNTVQLEAPPNAPTLLTPSGTAADAALAIVFGWQHNPVDTTAQTAYELEYSTDGGTTWTTTGQTTSPTSSWTLAAGTLANGQTLSWRVRTWGAYASPSPWSATATLPLSATPTATISTPADASTVGTSTLTVDWGYYQAAGLLQTAWQADLYDGTGTLLESLSDATAAVTATFASHLADTASYSVHVKVRSSAGLWSAEDVSAVTVSYEPPPTPTVTPTFDPATGAVQVQVTNPDTVAPLVDAVSSTISRSLDGGATWVTIATQVPLNSTVTDYVPPLQATVTYKATAVSATPSTADSATVDVATVGSTWAWLNGGDGFGQAVRLGSNVQIGFQSSTVKALYAFAGRTKPVEFSGTQQSRSIQLSATLWADYVQSASGQSTWDEIEALTLLPGPHCLRDLDGRRVFVSAQSSAIQGLGPGAARGVAVTLTEIDWTE